MDDFIKYAESHSGLTAYLPSKRDSLHWDKQWLCNVLYTLDEEGINEMINGVIAKRQVKIETKKDLKVNIRDEFLEAFDRCLTFSGKFIDFTDFHRA